MWVSAARGLIDWPFISLEVFDWHGGRCLLCGVCRICIFVPLFVGLPRGVVVLVCHSFRRSNLIGSWGQCCFVVSRTGIQSCGSSFAFIFRGAVPRGVVILVNYSLRRRYLIGICGVCMAICPFFLVPRRFLSVLSSYRPPIQI